MRHIFKSGELVENSICAILHIWGSLVFEYNVKYYNLDVI